MVRIPTLLRPRLTWRYAISSFTVLYVTYCILTFQPFFSSDLPPYSGQYDVGTIDIEVPRRPQRIGDEVFKENGAPAFELETVLFSVFYPATKQTPSRKSRHSWISKPVSLTAEGYLRFGHVNNFLLTPITTLVLWALVGGRRIPAEVDVPLTSGETTVREGFEELAVRSDQQFPVVIFSHGMASSRTDYTKYLGELASQGHIVAAVEHRDGSCPGSMILRKDGSQTPFFGFTKSDLETQPHDGINQEKYKQLQLAFRQLEMEQTYQVLKNINEGQGDRIFDANSRGEGQDLKEWKGRLDLNQMAVAGHSFGATLALRTLKGASSDAFPAKGAIVLDPGKSSGPLNSEIDVPTLIIHSQSWSQTITIFRGRPHFEVVKDLATGIIKKGKAAWFMTSMGTSHPSVTDAPLIEPLLLSWTTGATINVREGVHQYVQTSLEFLRYLKTGEKKRILQEAATHPTYGEDVRDEKRKGSMPADVGKYWQIHVSPQGS